MRPLTKWSHVVHKNSRSTLSITSNKVRQIIGRTLVCLLILLECWLNKARVKLLLVVQWVWHTNSIRLQFGFKICRWECNWCWFNSHSKCNVWMRIQFAFKQNQVWRGINIVVIESHMITRYSICKWYILFSCQSCKVLLNCYIVINN